MRWASLLCFCMFLAFTAGVVNGPAFAADLGEQRQDYPDERASEENVDPAQQVAEFCYGQGRICRKICRLNSKFDDNFDGCPQSCESRAGRCSRTGCYRWSEPEYLIAERFGGYRCPL